MGERVFEVEDDQRCEFCGALGALDLYGTWICPECAAGIFEEPEAGEEKNGTTR
jgi:hypothetical protein